MWVSFVPRTLACDWSYPAISTIDEPSDARLALVLGYGAAWCWLLRRLALRQTHVAGAVCLAFGLCPFFLASNVLVGVGTCKAERVLYLPSLGSCMALSLLLHSLALRRLPCAKPPTQPPAGPTAPHRERSRAWRLLLPWLAGLALVAAFTAQCARYADVWRTGLGLWEHALRTQEGRPAWMRSGPTTHAVGEYGLQLSWAGNNPEAERVLERQLRMAEEERLDFLAGGSRRAGGAASEGTIDLGGYGPLTLVYRMNGDPFKALACAEKALALFELSRAEGLGETKKRELGLVLGGRALALYLVQPQFALGEMHKALAVSNSKDAVVLKLAEQLAQAMRKDGAEPGGLPGAPQSPQQQAGAAGIGGAQPPEQVLARIRQLLSDPEVQLALRDLQTGTHGHAKYAHDARIRELAWLQAQLDPSATQPQQQQQQQQQGQPQQPARLELPESMEDLAAWAAQAQRDQPPRTHIAPVERAAQGPSAELGPLPAYATGAGGDPLETRPSASSSRAAAHLQPKLEFASETPSTVRDEGIAAFKLGSMAANRGDVHGALPHYCRALERFSHCVQQVQCLVGIVDTSYIKLKLHAALAAHGHAGALREGYCTRQTAKRAVELIALQLGASGERTSASYVQRVGPLLDELGAHVEAGAGAPCVEADALCGEEVGLLQKLGA
jgi:hypothetical protein